MKVNLHSRVCTYVGEGVAIVEWLNYCGDMKLLSGDFGNEEDPV